MALPATGPISMSQVNVELGLSATALITLNDTAVRNLAGVASGTISMQNMLGKSSAFAFTIAANQTNADLRTLAINAGWSGSDAVQATISSGVVITANSTAARAMTVSGSFPAGVTLINNGTIVGMGGGGGRGGNGGTKSDPNAGIAGASGGAALDVAVALTLQNNGTIAGGGGGGGGGGGRNSNNNSQRVAGGGGGGGRSGLTNSAGGLGGVTVSQGSGSAGGAGTLSSAGAGGASSTSSGGFTNGFGGNGGNWGAGGGSGAAAVNSPDSGVVAAGGAAGAAVIGNSNITYTATGTRLGPIT